MKDIVVIRPLLAVYIYTQCPLCNAMNYFERTNTFHPDSKMRCEGCGAAIEMELVAIHDARTLIDTDDLKDDDITALLVNQEQKILLGQENLVISNPVQKITIERSAFYSAMTCCSFCDEYSIVSYNHLGQPHAAQWCPECGAELVITVIVKGTVTGDISEWYEASVEEFYQPEGADKNEDAV